MIARTAVYALAGLFLSLSLTFASERSYWEGSIEFRGDRLAIRLALDDSGPSAELDVPQMIMAWESVPVERTGASHLKVTFPFGIGAFEFDPDSSAITVHRASGDETVTLRLDRAQPPEFTTELVSFTQGTVTLAGTVVLPPGEGPHPAVVLVHGSATGTRSSWTYRSWADLFVRLGSAVLLYDRRGVAESTGSGGPATFYDLADDVLAGVAYLGSRSDVDSARIGLKGSSQGAWIASLAASHSDDVAFLLLTSAPAVTPAAQEMHRVEYTMRRDGRTDAEIQDAVAYLRLYFYVVHSGQGAWPVLQSAAAAAAGTEWGRYVDQPRAAGDLEWWRINHAFEPAGVLGKVEIPVLALYGGSDVVVPYIENAPRLEHMLRAGACPEVTVELFPGADHRLEVPPGRDADGAWRWFRMAPGLLESISTWLLERGNLGRE